MTPSGSEVRRPETRWLMQTKIGGGHAPIEERGDCVPACIASILGKPIAAIANCHGVGWWDRLQTECGKHGYCLAQLDLDLEPPPGYWIATVPSLNLPPEPNGRQAFHVVVARWFEFIHDPSIGKRYDDASWDEAWNNEQIIEGWVLVPVDPVELAA